jgi:4-carboxymuconolactone decarboxylase
LDSWHALLEDGLHELAFITEVVLDHRIVAVADGCADLSQRHSIEPVLGEEPLSDIDDLLPLGLEEFEQRIFRGAQEFADVNLLPAPLPQSPYRHAGILSFVFGHVWQRPGLTRKERQIITVAACAADDSPNPLKTHVAAAVHSGDITREEMDEIVLQFSAYYGFPKGEALRDAADAAFADTIAVDLDDWREAARATPWEVRPAMPVQIWEPQPRTGR